ncbi:MAG TPA: four-carbon acid sugar kinase family protein, partial [Thermomicrobiales bacterium]
MKEVTARPLAELFAGLPPAPDEAPLLAAIRAHLATDRRAVVVLDDDPTGTQTVYDLSVYTRWDVDTLAGALGADGTGFYILTNSRSLPESEAVALNRAIAAHLRAAAMRVGRPFTIISRSDSTLRGHFPAETDALLGLPPEDGSAPQIVLAPYFAEGKRITVGDVHWVHDGTTAVPVGATEFARDATFGFAASDLRDWAVEKSGGRWAHDDVAALPLATVRQGAEAVAAWFLATQQPVIVINSAEDGDMAAAVLGMMEAEAAGRRYLCRTAAAFVRARFGLPRRPLLAPAEMVRDVGPGLVVVGSYVPRSSAQLEHARALETARAIEVPADALLDERRERAIQAAIDAINDAWDEGADALLFTSRAVLQNRADEAANLRVGRQISSALVAIVRGLEREPAWFIAKGGITSSDMATEALGIRHATVLGALIPGVPVWRAVDSDRWPDVPLVIFPGNVGAEDDLARA